MGIVKADFLLNKISYFADFIQNKSVILIKPYYLLVNKFILQYNSRIEVIQCY